VDNFTSTDPMDAPTMVIQSITREQAQQMSIYSFQTLLRSKHVIIPDCDLPIIPCDRRGLTSLNGLKELVNIEGDLILIFRRDSFFLIFNF